jgi:transcriptional regulator with XRE-family HTH domain
MGIARQTPPSQELKNFASRLSKAIDLKKIELSVIAKKLGCAPVDVKKMLSGMREPTMKKLIVLANVLECSVDYLLGLTPEPQRASVVIEAGTNPGRPQSSQRGQTSGQIAGNAEQFAAIIPELLDSDTELLIYIAGFLIERKEKRLAKIAEAVTARTPKEVESSSLPKSNSEFDEEDFGEEDDLWDDVEDESFEDDDFEDGDFEGEDDDDFEDDFDN